MPIGPGAGSISRGAPWVGGSCASEQGFGAQNWADRSHLLCKPPFKPAPVASTRLGRSTPTSTCPAAPKQLPVDYSSSSSSSELQRSASLTMRPVPDMGREPGWEPDCEGAELGWELTMAKEGMELGGPRGRDGKRGGVDGGRPLDEAPGTGAGAGLSGTSDSESDASESAIRRAARARARAAWVLAELEPTDRLRCALWARSAATRRRRASSSLLLLVSPLCAASSSSMSMTSRDSSSAASGSSGTSSWAGSGSGGGVGF
mmetsp:Transcript_57986/g.103552  ORF Transcript_57986/g.103552 Transcript_57986/m.103552 type:complete len:261 (+) Transcript_57986:153-935(+)